MTFKVSTSQPVNLILKHFGLAHTVSHHFSTIHFNIISPFAPKPFKEFVPSGFSD
jgi:hypothetical protein